MFIPTDILKAVNACVDSKRERLQQTCFDYDEKKNELTIVAADAQVMVVYTMPVKQDDKDFCLKYFSNNQAYLITKAHFATKTNVVLFEEKNGGLIANGEPVKRYDGLYPNWHGMISYSNLRPARDYCGFDKNLISKADKAWGWRKRDNNTIMATRPLVVALADEPDHLLPHIWTDETGAVKKTLFLMPLRLDR